MTTLYSHTSRPDWGTAQLIREEDGKRTFLFWNGQQRTFGKLHWALMVPVDAGVAENTTKTTPTPTVLPGSEGTDLRALRLQTRILGNPITKKHYEEAISNVPREGMYGNTGYHLMRDVLEAWIVGEYEFGAPGLSKAIEYLEHSRAVGERWGDAYVFHQSLHAEVLGLAHWLQGNPKQSQEAFVAAAEAETVYFESAAKVRRSTLGSLYLRWMAAGNPQRGLDVASSVPIPRPRAHIEDVKEGFWNRYYDALGRTLKSLAEELLKGKNKRALYDKAMKYLATELKHNLSRNDYSLVDFPQHAMWMKVFATDVLGINDPKLALAQLYLLMPTVKRPPEIAQRLATKSIL
jgi:hypothetical protein